MDEEELMLRQRSDARLRKLRGRRTRVMVEADLLALRDVAPRTGDQDELIGLYVRMLARWDDLG